MEIEVEGMTCGECVKAVSNAVERLGGRALVDIQLRHVVIEGPVSREEVLRAIENEGYRVVTVRDGPGTGTTGG